MLTTPPEPRECRATRPHLSGGGGEPAASARDGQAELLKADGPRRAIALFYDLRLLVRHERTTRRLLAALARSPQHHRRLRSARHLTAASS